MDDVATREGRTVLFVSHNMGAVNLLCSRAILMQRGTLILDGPTKQVTRKYFDGGNALTVWTRSAPVNAQGICLLEARILVDGRLAAQQISTDQAFVVEVVIHSQSSYRDAEIAVRFTNHEGFPVLTTANGDQADAFQPIEPGRHTLRAHIPAYLLATGTYSLLIAALIPDKILFEMIDSEIQITIEELGPQASATRDGRLGVVNPRLAWEQQAEDGSPLPDRSPLLNRQ